MTYMRAWMSLKFGQIRLLVSMATDRVIMEKKTVLPLFLVCFFIRSFSYLQVMMTCMRARRSSKFFSTILDQILFILAGNDGIHKSLDVFEIQPDPIRDHRVSCS